MFLLLQEGILLLGYYLVRSGYKFSYFCFKYMYVCCGYFSCLSSMRAAWAYF